MFKPKMKFTYDEMRIIVMALIELKNQLIAEGRYTDAVDELLIKLQKVRRCCYGCDSGEINNLHRYSSH